MRVLVTGGTGYLGQAIVGSLVARGHEPVVFARTATRSGLPGILVDGDVRDDDALVEAGRRCEAACHSAALVSVWRRRPAEFDEINVGGLENMLRLVSRLRLARLVYTSSFLCLPPAGETAPLRLNDYQRTKVMADEIAERAVRAGAPIVRLYPGVMFGPGPATEGNLVGRLVADHLERRLAGIVGADRVWSYADVAQVARAHVTALERGRIGARYQVGGENAPQMRVFEAVRRLTGRALPRRIPAWAARLAARAEVWRATVTRRPARVTPGTVGILDRDWPLASDEAVADLGYEITPLEIGVERIVAELTRDGRTRR
jgi:farnesol dehydrogenase